MKNWRKIDQMFSFSTYFHYRLFLFHNFVLFLHFYLTSLLHQSFSVVLRSKLRSSAVMPAEVSPWRSGLTLAADSTRSSCQLSALSVFHSTCNICSLLTRLTTVFRSAWITIIWCSIAENIHIVCMCLQRRQVVTKTYLTTVGFSRILSF